MFRCKFFRTGIVLLAGILAAGQSFAVERAADFTLFDEQGKAVELHYHHQADAVVLLVHKIGSEAVSESAAGLESLLADFPDADLPVFMVNPEMSVSRAALAADRQSSGADYPILQDNMQLVAQTYGFSKAGEVLLIDPDRWQIVFRGPLDAQGLTLAAARLEALQAGEPVELTALTLPDSWDPISYRPVSADLSYAETIAPILVEKCVSCHREGGIGPWAMTSHQMVMGFSPMIREVILTKRMPPWHADPEVNSFRHDMSLSTEEARSLVAWIDAGSQAGTGEDPLQTAEISSSEWELGEPDMIVELPAFTVPATGSLDYQFFEVESHLPEDVWVRAVQVAPGDRQVVHHAIATFGEGSEVDGQADSGESLLQSQLMTFVPGNETYEYPEGTGVFIPAGSAFFTQMHYTPYGRETVDKTRIGLYFSEESPEYMLQHYSIVDQGLRIPAGEPAHEESAYYEFQRDAVIYSLFPHAHYRGRSSRFTVQYPDGSEELVLSVPNYDFNWQRYFQFEKPIAVPAGSRVIHSTVYDNSTANLSNPDPSVVVRFGEQTWEEMLYGGISFRYADVRPGDNQIDKMAYLSSLGMGFMDTNMDGKVALDEMPAQQRKALAMPFLMLDKDKSGGLEHEEFKNLMSTSGNPF